MSSFKSGAATTSGTKVNPPGFKEFTVKLARDIKKKYNIMQFNRGDKMDFSKCSKIVMERENNMRTFNTSGFYEDMPSEGAGSEYGRERREEARRKKFGIRTRKYIEDDQPWLLKVAGKPEKKYRGKKEGLITENANYYLFTQQADGTFHAIPVDSWYSFQQSIKHSTLNAEEAEEEFNRRDHSFNYFSLMVQKRLKEKTDDDVANPDKKGKKKNKAKRKTNSLTILEDDEYRDMMTSDEESDEDDDQEKKKKKKKKGPARPKKKDSGSEAEEESDNGDFEGEEMDYMSEVSSDEEAEQQKMEMKGLDEEMKHIEEEEEEEEDEAAEGNEDKKKAESEGATKEGEKTNKKDSSSSGGSDSDDSDIDDSKIISSIFMQKKNIPANKKTPPKSSSKSSSRGGSRPSTPITTGVGSATVTDGAGDKTTDNTLKSAAVKLQTPNTGNKRPTGSPEPRPSKKARTESPLPTGSKTQPTPEVGLTEDVVRRYLMRKPMTTKDLLVKLNPKKTGLTSVEVVKRVTVILRKLNPDKLKIKDKMYWHIKDDSKPSAR